MYILGFLDMTVSRSALYKQATFARLELPISFCVVCVFLDIFFSFQGAEM